MILPSWLVFPQFLFFSFFFFLVSFFSSFLSSLLLPSLFLLLSSCELTTVSLTASRGICLRHSRLLLSNSCKGLRPPLVNTSECNNKMSILKKKKHTQSFYVKSEERHKIVNMKTNVLLCSVAILTRYSSIVNHSNCSFHKVM